MITYLADERDRMATNYDLSQFCYKECVFSKPNSELVLTRSSLSTEQLVAIDYVDPDTSCEVSGQGSAGGIDLYMLLFI